MTIFTPTAMADALLFSLLSTDAEGLQLQASRADTHSVTLEFERASVSCLDLDAAIADAVIARLALMASLDFTARDERSGALSVLLGSERHTVNLSIRPGDGHLSAYLRRVIAQPQTLAPSLADPGMPKQIGDYQVLEELGRGALGVVLRAEHQLLQKSVAIKLWSLAATRTSKANAALLREARAASATRHPGVVDVYDILRLPDGRIAMVMELIDGETLASRILVGGAFEPLEAVRIARAIADVLHATHSSGIVHRDLKPENIFLLPDGRVKVVDFGAALHTEHPDQKASTLGTPWYMAPEQVLGRPTDCRSDIYSLGCVLFEMLSSRCPFDGNDPRVVMMKQVEEPVPPLESPGTPLPEGLERVVLRALAKHPEQRQQSALELISELDAVSETMMRPGWRKWLGR